MKSELVRPYAIATWPDGLMLIRQDSSRSWRIIIGSPDDMGAARWINTPETLSKINFFRWSSGELSASAHLWSKKKNARAATVWALGLLGAEGRHISSPRSFGLPKFLRNDDLVVRLRRDLSSVNLEPAEYRSSIWKCTTERFLEGLTETSHQETARSLSGEIIWKNTLGGRMVMTVPNLQDVSNGATPTWAIESISGWRLPPSDISPYDALFQAGLLMMNKDYPQWLEKNGDPGTMVDDMSAYTLLGLPFPPAMEPDEFDRWREAMP